MKPLTEPPHICLITQGKATPQNYHTQRNVIIETIRSAISDGVSMIQIREKALGGRDLFDLVSRSVTIAKEAETIITVNDRTDVAAAAGADGVHLPESSFPPSVVKGAFPGLLIGASIHTLEAAAIAASGGADYVFFGPVFATPGKGAPVGLASLADVCSRIGGVPVIALGGIDDANCDSIVEAGAAGVAAIRALNDDESRRLVVRKLRSTR